MEEIKVKQLVEAGVHFGHRKDKWNPKMGAFILTERRGIYVIDLKKTIEYLQKAYEVVSSNIRIGKTFLFVGTKKQARDIIKEEAERAEVFYVSNRWLGGTLTNFSTIRKTVDRMKSLEEKIEKEEFGDLTKKEIISLERELLKLKKNLYGIRDMENLPDMIYICDIRKEKNAIREAKKLGIPVVGIIDTNVDPTPVDYPIPANDDAIKSISIITKTIANAVLEGRRGGDSAVVSSE
ncbi:30S ribosomal protein S2 [candidate division WOR-3 bacterium]|nr:30S ribosomal protein S2 [candidate division WOR-3 bacterium]